MICNLFYLAKFLRLFQRYIWANQQRAKLMRNFVILKFIFMPPVKAAIHVLWQFAKIVAQN